jgi:hypothetical protein
MPLKLAQADNRAAAALIASSRQDGLAVRFLRGMKGMVMCVVCSAVGVTYSGTKFRMLK